MARTLQPLRVLLPAYPMPALNHAAEDRRGELCRALETGLDGVTTCGLVTHPYQYFSVEGVRDQLRPEVVDVTEERMGAEIASSLGIGTPRTRCDAMDLDGIDRGRVGLPFW